MEVLKRKLKEDEINLYIISDIHLGAENFRNHEFRQMVKAIEEDPIGYWLGLGDYIDAITVMDKRFSPGELSTHYHLKDLKDLPRLQMQEFYSIIRPIRNKCLALGVGNHEEAYIKYNGFDIYDYLATDLMEQRELKGGYNYFLQLNLGKNTTRNCTLYCTHGVGGGGYREGYSTNLIHDIAKDKRADIYLMGHVHQLSKDVRQKIGINSAGKLTKYYKYYAVCGSFLDKYHLGTSGYFEKNRGWETQAGYIKFNISMRNNLHDLKIKCHQVDL